MFFYPPLILKVRTLQLPPCPPGREIRNSKFQITNSCKMKLFGI